jgi:hypothetical protein
MIDFHPEHINAPITDYLYNKIMKSWEGHQNVKNAIDAILAGRTHKGITTRRIGVSSKFEAKPLSQLPNLVDSESKDIPMQWLEKPYFDAILTQIKWYKPINDSWAMEPSLNNAAMDSFLLKCLILCRSSQSREFWKAKLPTLVSNPNYNINCAIWDKLAIKPTYYKHGIKEEHGLKYFYKVSAKNSLNIIYDDDGAFCFENPKKAMARDSRLVDTPEAIPYGKVKVFVIDKIPEVKLDLNTELSHYMVSGSGMVPMSWIETRGVSRCVFKEGGKFTTMPMPESIHKAFPDVDVVLSKASFKSGLNGIYSIKTNTPPEEMVNVSKDDAELYLVNRLEERRINGVPVYGYSFEVDIKVTNLIALYGLRSNDEDEELIGDNTEATSASYYTWAVEQIRLNPEFDLIDDIRQRLIRKELHYVGHNLNLKSQEFTVAAYSYGMDTAKDWMHKVMQTGIERGMIRSSVTEALDLQTGNVQFETHSIDDIKKLIDVVYPRTKISLGKFDPCDLRNFKDEIVCTPEEGRQRLDYLLNGYGSWSGLLSPNSKLIEVVDNQGQTSRFYIPSGKTMEEYIHAEEGSERVFFSGPAGNFLLLLLSIRNSKTNWTLKALNHSAAMQSDMLGKTMDNFTTPGGNYTMLPAPWLFANEIAILNKGIDNLFGKQLPIKNDDRVTFSKMPVLFNKAIADMNIKTGLPKSMFGEYNDRIIIALRNVYL